MYLALVQFICKSTLKSANSYRISLYITLTSIFMKNTINWKSLCNYSEISSISNISGVNNYVHKCNLFY